MNMKYFPTPRFQQGDTVMNRNTREKSFVYRTARRPFESEWTYGFRFLDFRGGLFVFEEDDVVGCNMVLTETINWIFL